MKTPIQTHKASKAGENEIHCGPRGIEPEVTASPRLPLPADAPPGEHGSVLVWRPFRAHSSPIDHAASLGL